MEQINQELENAHRKETELQARRSALKELTALRTRIAILEGTTIQDIPPITPGVPQLLVGQKRPAATDSYEPPRKSLRPAELPTYHGKNANELRTFLQTAKVVFRQTPYNFPDDEAKILHIMPYLQGEAKHRWYDHEEKIDIRFPIEEGKSN